MSVLGSNEVLLQRETGKPLAAEAAARFSAETQAVVIPTPAQLAEERSKKYAALEIAATTEIVRGLHSAQTLDWPVQVFTEVPAVVRDAVCLKFRAQGWAVTFRHEQRDGQWVEIRPLEAQS